MNHGMCGVEWDSRGAAVLCLCGWFSDPPTPVGPGWIEELTDALNTHLEAANE